MREDSSARKELIPFDMISEPSPKIRREQLHEQSDRNRIGRIALMRQHEIYSRLKDKSYIPPQNPLPKLQQWLLILDQRYKVITPESTFIFIWNLWVTLAILFNFFQIPVALFLTDRVYETQTNTVLGLFLNILFLFILLFDFPIRFNLAYYQKGKLITSRLSIVKQYLKLQFWFDLGGWLVLVIYIVADEPSLVYLKLLFYVKMWSLVKIDEQTGRWLEMGRISYAFYRLLRVVIGLWFLATWIAGIFFAIDYSFYLEKGFYYQQNQLWLTNTSAVGNLNLIINFSWYVWYEYALYWALQTSSTVGYGDLTPMNPPQVFYCNLVILMMTVVFAFFINKIWEIIGEAQESSVQYSENWKSLKKFLRDSKISSHTKQKISNYLYQIWLDDDDDQMEQTINSILSAELKDEFYIETKSRFFDHLPIIERIQRNFLTFKNLLVKLVYVIDEQNFSEREFIYREGDSDMNLYYVKKGKVKLEIQGSQLGQQIENNESFGEQGFFLQTPRIHFAQCLSFCKIWRISFDVFKKNIQQYPFINEKYCEIISEIIFQNQVRYLNIPCWKCGSFNHLLQNCEKIRSWRKQLDRTQNTLEDLSQNERVFVSRAKHFSQKIRKFKIKRSSQKIQAVYSMNHFKTQHNMY